MLKKHLIQLAGVLAITILATAPARASIIFQIEEQGADIVVGYSGSIDLTGLDFHGSNTTGGTLAALNSTSGTIGNQNGAFDGYGYSGLDFVSFGFGPLALTVDTFGDIFAILDAPDIGFAQLQVPIGYSGGALLGGFRFAGQSFASLGLTSGTTFTNTLRNQDTIIIQVGPAEVPAPATLALFGLGLAGFGWSRSRKA